MYIGIFFERTGVYDKFYTEEFTSGVFFKEDFSVVDFDE